MTRFERAQVVGVRAEQLSQGAPPQVPVQGPGDGAVAVARREMDAGKLPPMSLGRHLPDGGAVRVAVADVLFRDPWL